MPLNADWRHVTHRASTVVIMDANDIWERALDYDVELSAPGDVALRDVLTFDGSAQNGGLVDAVESYLQDEEFPLARVVDSYRFLGMDATAALVDGAREQFEAADGDDESLEHLELTLDPQYPLDGEDISERLTAKLAADPGAFTATT